MYTYPRNVPIKIQKDELEISLNLLDFIKEVCQLPDWQTYKKFRVILSLIFTWLRLTWSIQNYLEPVYQCLRNVFKKFQKDMASRSVGILLFNFGKEVSKQPDWHTYKKFRITWMEPVYQHLRNVSKKSRKISHPELEISLSNFGKEVSKQTDWQTYKKFTII